MIKGCAKRVVVVRDIDSGLFEEAFFIVRAGALGKKIPEEDFLGEADRLVKNGNLTRLPSTTLPHDPPSNSKTLCVTQKRETKKVAATTKSTVLRDLLMFLCGFGVSALFCTFIY